MKKRVGLPAVSTAPSSLFDSQMSRIPSHSEPCAESPSILVTAFSLHPSLLQLKDDVFDSACFRI